MIKRFVLLLIVIISFAHYCWADSGGRYGYRGVIGDSRIGMSLNWVDNNVSGEYFYIRWLKDISVKGKIDGRKIVLNEFNAKGEVTAIFKGQFLDHAPEYKEEPIKYEVIEGEWSRADGSKRQRFRLVTDGEGALGKNLYSNAGFDNDQMVETFAKEVKKSFISNNKEKVASMINFPVTVKIKGNPVKLKDKTDFIKYYKKVINQDFLDSLRDSSPHRMFVRSEGVMLGEHGEIWIGVRNGQARIIQINNDASDTGKFKVLWRINKGADIVLDDAYLKKAPDQIKAILGYISAPTGSECRWENDQSNEDMSNLKCKLTWALGLGYQASKKHKDFLHYWFRNDPKLSHFDGFSIVPYTATIQSTFDYISMQELDGGEYRVEYKISWSNDRENEGGFEKYVDRFRVYSDQVILVSEKVVQKGKY